MRLTGRRESNNVDDRRGMGMGTKAGIGGIGGIILIALITFLSGGDMGDVVNNVLQQELQGPTEVQTGGHNISFLRRKRNLRTSLNRFLQVRKMCGLNSFSCMACAINTLPLVLYTWCCTNCLWGWLRCNGTFLLFGRPTPLSRLKFL